MLFRSINLKDVLDIQIIDTPHPGDKIFLAPKSELKGFDYKLHSFEFVAVNNLPIGKFTDNIKLEYKNNISQIIRNNPTISEETILELRENFNAKIEAEGIKIFENILRKNNYEEYAIPYLSQVFGVKISMYKLFLTFEDFREVLVC